MKIGLRGTLSVLRALEMLPPVKLRSPVKSSLARKSVWVRSPQSGILRFTKRLGAQVEKGDVLGVVSDPFGVDEKEAVAHASGIIIGQTTMPLVHQGEAVYHIAVFEDPDQVAQTIETLRQDHDADVEAAL